MVLHVVGRASWPGDTTMGRKMTFENGQACSLLFFCINHMIVYMKQTHHLINSEEVVLQLIDIENLCGGSCQVFKFHSQVKEVVASFGSSESFLTVVAAGPNAIQSCPQLLWDWEFDRFLIGKGVDGADNRLLDVISEPQLRRVGEVQIWSGDHCFANISRSLVRSGVRVHVFSRLNSLAESLRSAATCVTFLSELQVTDSSELALAF